VTLVLIVIEQEENNAYSWTHLDIWAARSGTELLPTNQS